MSKVCESWTLEELTAIDEKEMEALLSFYVPGTVPTFEKIHFDDDLADFAFDGSFGWW